jgi:GntR family transcriptional repressor for pyruvate dehydrogenase complex
MTKATKPRLLDADSPTSIFHPIMGSRAFEEVVDQITFAIRAGVYRVGDRLPTIDQLSRLMGTSRPTVGDAIEVLSGGGVVEARRGMNGGIAVVSEDIPVTLMRRAGGWRRAAIRELVEARRAVEMELALLAGERATEQDIQTMREAVTMLEGVRGDPRKWQQYDYLLHYAIGRAAKSELLAYFQHMILEQLAMLLPGYYAEEEDPDQLIHSHRETLAAIQSRNPERIRSVMQAHVGILESDLQRLSSNLHRLGRKAAIRSRKRG